MNQFENTPANGRQLFRFALLATTAGLAVLIAGSATAQTTQPGPGAVEEVVVTGSRIANGFRAPTPVTVVDQKAVERRAPASISDVLNELPEFRQTSGPGQTQRLFGGGQGGQNLIDLRGLGAVRTLILVDGDRFTPTGTDGTIDTNMVPTGLVDRVDVVTGGASAAYGSDAVAGVVNFVLKDRLRGIVGSVQDGFSQRGDARERVFSLSGGFGFAGDRGHIVIGGDYSDNGGVGTIYSREWGRRQPGLMPFGATRAANIPAQVFATDVTYSSQSAGGVITAGPLKGTAFGAGGQPFPFQYGLVSGAQMSGGANPGMNPFGNWPLLTALTRRNALMRVGYDITPSTEAYLEINYGYSLGENFTSFHQSPTIIVQQSNPYLPASVKAAMIANNLATISMGRVDTEQGGPNAPASHETWRGIVGLKGTVFGDWKWDVSYQNGHTHNVRNIDNAFLSANYLAAAYVTTDANGTPICGPIATNPNLTATTRAQVQPGCVPVNIFGIGSPTSAAQHYYTGNSWQFTRVSEESAAVNLSGTPFSTWAGPVQLAVGAEHRHDALVALTDSNSIAALYSSGSGAAYQGSESVSEYYVETGVPLAKEMPFAKSLDLNAAVRRTDYGLSGPVTTWKIGLTYEPFDALRFRATRSRDIRAPHLNELYASGTAGVGTASANNPFNGRSGALITQGFGNINLKPEVADTTTGGVVFQPQWAWAQGFRASVDYYNIDLQDVIASVSALDILTRCHDGLTQYCSSITFDNSAFGIALVQTKAFNLNRLQTDGADIEVDYRVPLQSLPGDIPGNLNLRALGTKVMDQKTTDALGTIDRAGALQGGGVPTWTWNFDATYVLNQFSGSLTARYTSAALFDATLAGPDSKNYNPTLSNSINDNTFPSAVYFSLSGSYDLVRTDAKRLQVFGVINNLLDRRPPQFAAIGINSGGNPYDLIGRRFKVGLRFNY